MVQTLLHISTKNHKKKYIKTAGYIAYIFVYRSTLNADEFIKFEAALMWCKNNSDRDVVKFRQVHKRRGKISQIKMFNLNLQKNKSYYMNFKRIIFKFHVV